MYMFMRGYDFIAVTLSDNSCLSDFENHDPQKLKNTCNLGEHKYRLNNKSEMSGPTKTETNTRCPIDIKIFLVNSVVCALLRSVSHFCQSNVKEILFYSLFCHLH